jgi:hypothetical protein
MTVAQGNIALGTELTYAFSAEVSKDDLVVASGVTDDGELKVAKRAYNDAQPIGEVITEPKFMGQIEKTAGTYTTGNYQRRRGTVRFFGQRIITRDIYLPQSQDLSAGEFLMPCNNDTYANYLEETTTQTSRIALEGATASGSAVSTTTVPVLEGFEVGSPDLT